MTITEVYLFYIGSYTYTAPDFGFFVPYFDLDVVRFPTPPYPIINIFIANYRRI
jgi:hypothetical protein